jgi:hypothetical protein
LPNYLGIYYGKGKYVKREERVHIRIWSTNMDVAQNSRVDFSKHKGENEKDKKERETELEVILIYSRIR